MYEIGHYHHRGIIAITQPRRVAAVTIAKRVAEEMGENIGDVVGYNVRFEDCTSEKTRVKYMTDGMLVREAMLDPELKKYSAILLDEAHERTLHTDVLFAVAKAAQARRPELKIIVMSATLEADKFAQYFGAEILFVEGRQFPVQTFYMNEPASDYMDAALSTVLQIHLGMNMTGGQDPDTLEDTTHDQPGDILVFLTGREEIDSMEKLLKEKMKLFPSGTRDLLVCPIYAALPPEQQLKVFEPTPPNMRKVILATNIAETSITINGVRFVVDTGLVKTRSYFSKIGMHTLQVATTSKAAARQRAGRAGREAPGICYRLYTEEVYAKMADSSVPEIKRSNLTHAVLQLKAMGIDDVINFDYMDRPAESAITKALTTLLCLKALDETTGHINDLGRRMSSLPLEPMFAKAVIMSQDFACANEVITVVSMLSTEGVFFTPQDKRDEADKARKRFVSSEGDHLTLLNVYREFSRHLRLSSQHTDAGQFELDMAKKVESKGARRWCREHFINHKAMVKVVNVRMQIMQYASAASIIISPDQPLNEELSKNIRRCFVSGFFMQTAQYMPDTKSYSTTIDHREVYIHPSSVMFLTKRSPFILYNELAVTTKTYVRDVCTIDSAWLAELAPQVFAIKPAAAPSKGQTPAKAAEKQESVKDMRSRVMSGMVDFSPNTKR
eukprot:TRINITY_DN5828_c0_g1_i4.p1 TRINITY_DN5828_c0_g1~~TRINITY_DN5828_c0_g1_i4.p1  ORF type:complete len:671 (+),score=182.62 TRINITY_DN5828_c0_g1_i4:464-2476(+)